MCTRGPEIRISIKIPVFQTVCVSSMYEKLKRGQSYEHLNITTGTHTVQTQISASIFYFLGLIYTNRMKFWAHKYKRISMNLDTSEAF